MSAELDGMQQRAENEGMQSLVVRRFVPATIPPARPGPQLYMAHDPFDARCEKIRGLRTELLLRREHSGQADVIALLSPGAGDGRSQLAAEIAIAFAQLGRPTLLVDADLRNPAQHLLFGANNHAGLSQALELGSTPYLQSVEGLPHLALLTAGLPPDNPLELLLNSRFANMIEGWRETYDFVVLDTAPITHYSDGLAVASLVKRVLALSRARHTSHRESRDMLRRLVATRSQVVGAVINHF